MRFLISLILALSPVALFSGAFYVPVEYADYMLIASPIALVLAIIFEIKTYKPNFETLSSISTLDSTKPSELKTELIEPTIESTPEVEEDEEIEIGEIKDDIVTEKNDEETSSTEDSSEAPKEKTDSNRRKAPVIEPSSSDFSNSGEISWDSDFRLTAKK